MCLFLTARISGHDSTSSINTLNSNHTYSSYHHTKQPSNTSIEESPPTLSAGLNKTYTQESNGQTITEDEDDDYDEHVSSKVRRCFGNTMCMPQNLLCFKVWLVKHFNVFNMQILNKIACARIEKRIVSCTSESLDFKLSEYQILSATLQKIF